MNTQIKPITLEASASRVRISTQLISALGWSDYPGDFSCYGLLRKPGEILCAPVDLNVEGGDHPFQIALDIAESNIPQPVPELADIPSTRVILATHRVKKFDAHWVSAAKKQLDLKIGKEMSLFLGKETNMHVYPISWGKILVLLSEQSFYAGLQSDFTEGSLNI